MPTNSYRCWVFNPFVAQVINPISSSLDEGGLLPVAGAQGIVPSVGEDDLPAHGHAHMVHVGAAQAVLLDLVHTVCFPGRKWGWGGQLLAFSPSTPDAGICPGSFSLDLSTSTKLLLILISIIFWEVPH